MRVRSAVDLPHKLLALIIVAVMVVCCFVLPWVLGLVLTAPVVAFLAWIYFGTYYEFREDYLYCRSGPYVERIRYENIKSARLCANFYSSLALSRKRIEIRQRKKGRILGTTYISPVNRKKFLMELISRCENLDAPKSGE